MKTFEVANTGTSSAKVRNPARRMEDGKRLPEPCRSTQARAMSSGIQRVSCIAGPCPFTKIDSDGLADGGRVFNVAVRDWSDPATFLIEAEVVHPMTGDTVRESFPAILGRTLNFTLPPEAEGVSIEAEVDGTRVVFPLGPDSCLSWAECNVKFAKDGTSTYRCELKPDSEFR